MKPEYIGIGNFDEENYVYGYCKCPLSADYAIKWPRIKDGKPHTYACTCEDCGTEVGVISKSYGPEVLADKDAIETIEQEPCNDCISRQYLVEKAASWDKHFADGIRYVALTDILNAPSVTPQLKQEPCTVTEFADRCQECGAKYGKLLKFAEKVLDKIKAEIIENSIEDYKYHGCGSHDLIIETNDVLKIIDKYKSESEKEK